VPIIVLLVGILPLVASFTLYFSDWRPSSTVNHGELIKPVKQVADHALRDVDGNPVKFGDLRGQWLMLYFDAAACPQTCIDNLYRMRQTHIAQGKERDRVERLFVVTEGEATPELASRLADYAGMHIWSAEPATLEAIAVDFGEAPEPLAHQRNIYLIDPMGNLFMRYKPDVDPAGLRKDLERLLKYSGAG
jgi:cytochrome oxidase Cu insertion factor (SCO1/SenC/PrrC family)